MVVAAPPFDGVVRVADSSTTQVRRERVRKVLLVAYVQVARVQVAGVTNVTCTYVHVS
jgi:hypothetical protein